MKSSASLPTPPPTAHSSPCALALREELRGDLQDLRLVDVLARQAERAAHVHAAEHDAVELVDVAAARAWRRSS